MNFTTKPKKTAEDYADTVDEWVRVGLSHLRNLKQNAQARARAMRKLDTNQIGNLQGVLDMIQGLEKEDAPEQCALVPVQRSGSKDSELAEEATPSPTSSTPPISLDIDPLSVFKRVLARPPLDVGSPESEKAQGGPAQRARVVLPRQPPKRRTQALRRILEDS